MKNSISTAVTVVSDAQRYPVYSGSLIEGRDEGWGLDRLLGSDLDCLVVCGSAADWVLWDTDSGCETFPVRAQCVWLWDFNIKIALALAQATAGKVAVQTLMVGL